MEYMNNVSNGPNPSASGSSTVNKILCCECGVPIEPNATNMCVPCLRSHVDITENIPKQAAIFFCRNCERYLNPPNEWVQCSLESKELLSLCLKRLQGLRQVKLVDAGFVWTEPHSKRIKVKLTVHGEVMSDVVLQQVFVVEFTVNNQMCDDCHRTEAQDYWRCLVQVRQKAVNRKTLFYLEQMILKHKAHENTLGIKPNTGGLDFFYATEAHARKMVDFLQAVLPVKVTNSKKLISHDIHSNSYNYKYSYAVDIVPISKGSLVCLSKKLTQQLGHLAPICLVSKVANSIHLIDPQTAQMAEVQNMAFWKTPFEAICNPKQMIEFIVMDVEIIRESQRKTFPGQGPVSQRHTLADVWVVKAAELGINDNTIHVKSHLGNLLKPGDSVLGYDLREANVNNTDFEKLNAELLPDVLLIKKSYDKTVRKQNRNWKLKHLNEDVVVDTDIENEYNEFLEDLEEDPELRQNVNIFRDKNKQIPVDTNDMEDPSVPRITLEEMLDDLVLEDEEMGDV
ncbi:60S ribosomal export protein NMD3 [Anopheles maculipalpis]|uniref:60S ribosomal export protein NMD3 n=1 Tax=Anopheles maculipalpis TaxID=1496333 RepID=UPI00215902CA|nr:60S ribosomal export protein NMD3 [Anopheles maculipalpis]